MTDLRLAWAPVPGGAGATRAARRAVAWGLLRTLLAREGWPDVGLSNTCARCGGPHGAVQVSGAPWRASVSYAAGVAVAAIHPDRATRFAVDAEPLADPVRDLAGGAPGGLLRWVRAEAVLKAEGRGLRGDPDAVVIEETATGWRAQVRPEATAYAGRDVDGPPGVLVAIAVGGAGAIAVAGGGGVSR